jgi:hypothetical protein
MKQLYGIVIAAVFLAFGFYFVAIGYIGVQAIRLGNAFEPDQIVSAVMTIIGGTLATHFGMVFGFERANSTGAKSHATELTSLQTTAAWAYIVSLLIAGGFLVVNNFYYKQTSPEILVTLTMTLIGVVGGLLAVGLNVTPPAAFRTGPPNP